MSDIDPSVFIEAGVDIFSPFRDVTGTYANCPVRTIL